MKILGLLFVLCVAVSAQCPNCMTGFCTGTTCTDCNSGYYANMGTCTACDTCAGGHYVSSACTGTSDTVCSSCYSLCNSASSSCTGSTNADCTQCNQGNTFDPSIPGGGGCRACFVTNPSTCIHQKVIYGVCGFGSPATNDTECWTCLQVYKFPCADQYSTGETQPWFLPDSVADPCCNEMTIMALYNNADACAFTNAMYTCTGLYTTYPL